MTSPQQSSLFSSCEPDLPLYPAPIPTNRRPRADSTPLLSSAATPPPNLRVPPIKPTSSFMFKDPNPKYLREVVPGQPQKMRVTCTQPNCDWKPKIVDRFISSTSNYTSHYISKHKDIPTSEKQLQAIVAAGRIPGQYFEKKPKTNTEQHADYQAMFRKLQLDFILQNNLSFRTIDQPTYIALFSHLNPSVTLYSSRSLVRDLKKEFDKAHEGKKIQLGEHIAGGGRIALTTDAWSARNYHDYIAVTGHYQDKNNVHISLLLDIVRLSNPIHSGVYLAEVLCEVTD